MSYTIVPIFFSLLAVAMLCVLPVSTSVCDTKMAFYQLSDSVVRDLPELVCEDVYEPVIWNLLYRCCG